MLYESFYVVSTNKYVTATLPCVQGELVPAGKILFYI